MTMIQNKGYSFGTFQGVFVPSILTILGVIMYLRFGWVLAHAGLFLTIVIVTLATSITFLTSLSLAALVSNSPVGSGGAYFIISRSLGIEAGGAIGLPLFLAQALGIAFYISGFTESLQMLLPALNPIIIAIITLVILTVMAFYSANIALKSQFIVLGLITLSLISFFAGNTDRLNMMENNNEVIPKIGFWVVFAVFFPAVTGIEAGLGLSGDLKNAKKSLTWGTIYSVIVSYAVYLSIPIFLSTLSISAYVLAHNSMIMADVSRWRWLVIAGIWGATLSSAMGSLLSAPRTLQAISKDGLLPRFLARGHGKNNDPRAATIISFVIAIGGIMLGNLNTIAPVISMFFLTSYGLINLSAFIETIAGGPWWRPTFKTPWYLTAAGTFACFATMFMINPGATFISIFISIGIYSLIRRRRLKAHWGDVRTGLYMWLAQYVVYKLSSKNIDKRTWRPNLLVLTGSPVSRWHLVALADALTRGKGITTFAVLVGKDTNSLHINNVRETIKNYLLEQGVEGIVKVLATNNTYTGIITLMESYGFGPLKPNTIIMGAPGNLESMPEFIKIIRRCSELQLNLIILQKSTRIQPTTTEPSRIDVWWDPSSTNAGLLLALGFLLKVNRTLFKGALSIHTILNDEQNEIETKKNIGKMIDRMRLDAQVLFEKSEAKHHLDTISLESSDAAIAFLGFKSPLSFENDSMYESYLSNMIQKTANIPSTAMVMARENIDFDSLFVE
jgi:amino acid transporter